MVLITRKAEFSASHYCANEALSEEENEKLFGKAARRSGHGHNYVLEVTVAGEVDPVNGMIMDLKVLKEIINEQVVTVYDHRFLNHEVPPFDRVVPTAENIAKDIWSRLEPHVSGNGRRLHGIRLWETPDLYVDFSDDAAEETEKRPV
jgi:6-pyruvoyltetrahydropterin/6-carboxytetrahydropterin synthase